MPATTLDGKMPIGFRDYSRGFFDDPLTIPLVKDIATATRLTIFCGAGISLDQSIPTWAGLVKALLHDKVVAHSSLEQADADTACAALLENFDYIPSATIVDDLFAHTHPDGMKARNSQIVEALYGKDPLRMRVGLRSPSLAESVLRLAIVFALDNRDVHIVTTNYDDVLEFAGMERSEIASDLRSGGLALKPYWDSAPPSHSPGTIPVVHVHGYLPRDKSNNHSEIVFSEHDYYQWEDRSPFRGYLDQRLSSGAFLIVGSSLSDSNILHRVLSARRSGSTVVAVQPTQTEVARSKPIDRPFVYQLASYSEMRARSLGFQLLRPDFYGQVYQLLDEIRTCVAATDYKSYSDRITAWRAGFEPRFQDRDLRLSLTDQVREVVHNLSRKIGNGDRAKAEIWVRNPVERELQLWISSQSTWLPGDYWVKSVKLSNARLLDQAVVGCFAMNAPTHGRMQPLDPDRWTHYYAVPLHMDSASGRFIAAVACMFFHSPAHQASDEIPAVVRRADEILSAWSDFGVQALAGC